MSLSGRFATQKEGCLIVADYVSALAGVSHDEHLRARIASALGLLERDERGRIARVPSAEELLAAIERLRDALDRLPAEAGERLAE